MLDAEIHHQAGSSPPRTMGRRMPGNVDRRPWLIISTVEAQALLETALTEPRPSVTLSRAIRLLQDQLRWVQDGSGDKPRRPVLGGLHHVYERVA
jgi:hypothetical protein